MSSPKIPASSAPETAAEKNSRTIMVPVDQLIDLLHVTHAPERIEEFKHAISDGARLPPIGVIRLGGRWFIADGHKRFSAYKLLNYEEVEVEVWTGRRWLQDQWQQLRHKTAQQLRIVARAPFDPAARKQARRLWWDTVGHWQRIVRSAVSSAPNSEVSSLSGLSLQAADTSAIESGASSDLAGGKGSREIFGRLARECLAFRFQLVAVLLSLAAAAASQLYLTWIAKSWADGPLVTGDRVLMGTLLGRAAIVAGIMMVTMFCSRYLLAGLNQSLVQSLRDTAESRLLSLRLEVLRKFQSGDLISRLFNDANVVSEFVREILRRIFGETMLLVGAIAMILYLNWRLALLAGAAVPVVGVMITRIGRIIRGRAARAQHEVAALTSTFTEQLSGLTTIKGFQTEDSERRRFSRNNSDYRHHVMKTEFWSAFLMAMVWLMTATALLLIAWFGSKEVTAGRATRGALLAFCIYAVQTVEPLRRLSEVQGLMQRAIAAAARVYEIIDLGPSENEGVVKLMKPEGVELNFDSVSFSYPSGKRVLEWLHFRVAAGETLAIVSASGGGKSTIGRLLLRFYDADRGRILLDGIDISDLALSQLRRMICVVEQDPFVFNGTVAENVRYGTPRAPEKLVREAIDSAGLGPFVASLPRGINSALSEAGHNLSGGQKQRIAMARAIVRDPKILVLDEATSALDSETERQIFDQLSGWVSARTVIVLAHRLSTIGRFRRILVMANGRIVGDGDLETLLPRCPEFSDLFADQLDLGASRTEA